MWLFLISETTVKDYEKQETYKDRGQTDHGKHRLAHDIVGNMRDERWCIYRIDSGDNDCQRKQGQNATHDVTPFLTQGLSRAEMVSFR